MVTFEVHELDPGAITAEEVWVDRLLAIPIVDCARLNCKTARPDHVQTNLNIRGFSAHLQAGAILNAAPATTNHQPWAGIKPNVAVFVGMGREVAITRKC